MARETKSAAKMLNLGPKSLAWLAAVGIHNRTDLESVGAINAYNLCKAHGYNVSLNLLWALQGALMDIPSTRLSADVKQ